MARRLSSQAKRRHFRINAPQLVLVVVLVLAVPESALPRRVDPQSGRPQVKEPLMGANGTLIRINAPQLVLVVLVLVLAAPESALPRRVDTQPGRPRV